MANEMFVSFLALTLGLVLFWGFKVLPEENWQILAALPRSITADSRWKGINLTYYGFFIAGAYVLGTTIFFILLGALHIPLPVSFLIMALLALVCLPAAKIVAYLVEGKTHTWTVGGASFVGLILSPWLVSGINRITRPWLGWETALLPVLAAMAIAYAYGEGLGRLACISFGCCYGKPLVRCHPLIKRLFQKHHFIFYGRTKKIAYAHGFDGQPVLPIQAVTSVLYVGAAVGGTHLFLAGQVGAAFLLPLLTTQLWRLVSEFFRADFRGRQSISAYQVLSLLGAAYGLVVYRSLRDVTGPKADILAGLNSLWDPAVILFLQGLGLALFLLTGRSRVIDSEISVRVTGDGN